MILMKIRWMQPCMHFIDGVGFRRFPGEYDVVERSKAKALEAAGSAIICGIAMIPVVDYGLAIEEECYS